MAAEDVSPPLLEKRANLDQQEMYMTQNTNKEFPPLKLHEDDTVPPIATEDIQEPTENVWSHRQFQNVQNDITYAHRTQGPRPKSYTVTRILKLKIIPPFRREHFTNPALMERDVKQAYNTIMSIFQPKNRTKITISRTNILKNGKYFQILLVTAPAEAEEDVARIKTRGLNIMGRTIFPREMNSGNM